MTASAVARGRYFDSPAGQVHALTAGVTAADRPLLLCLHPAPYSGEYFRTALPALSAGREVIAPDCPGYGRSWIPSAPPSIADYAAVLLDALPSESPIDLMGFHSGGLVAAEIARAAPERVRRLVLVDAPCFDRDTRESLKHDVAQPPAFSTDLDCLGPAWAANVVKRDGLQPIDRSIALLADQLSAGRRSHYLFEAAFTYDWERRLAGLQTHATLIATNSPLRAPTQAAAAVIPGARLVAADALHAPVFERHTAEIAALVSEALDHD